MPSIAPTEINKQGDCWSPLRDLDPAVGSPRAKCDKIRPLLKFHPMLSPEKGISRDPWSSLVSNSGDWGAIAAGVGGLRSHQRGADAHFNPGVDHG